MNRIKVWVEAMRLRTLPVSVAGVIAGCACALMYGCFNWTPALICLAFAVLAQIASNFANEYFDYAGGLDKKGREGFRRGVTEGDISPHAMLIATIGTLAIDGLVGLSLIYYGGWWLLIPGILIAIFALAYSTGPWPLSHHGLGDVAVILFFGLVPVTLTCYVQGGDVAWSPRVLAIALAVGLAAADVLIVNNYRDVNDDREVGKHTTVVIFGRKAMACVYLAFACVAAGLCTAAMWGVASGWWIAAPIIYIAAMTALWHRMLNLDGHKLNPLLGKTAILLLAGSLMLLMSQI